MSKPVNLPDHSIEAIELNKGIDIEKLEPLKNKYKFKDEYNLQLALSEMPGWYDIYKEIQEKSSVKEQIRLFAELMKRCNSLSECFSKLGYKERKLLENKPHGEVNLNNLDHDLEMLANNSQIIAQQLKPLITDGRPKDTSIDRLIKHLANIYEEGTDRKPTCYYHSYECVYRGEFLDFICEILSELGIIRSRSTIGERVKAVLKPKRGKTTV